MRRRAGTRTGLLAWLQGFLPAATSVGFDHVSEVFDAEPPHRPGGTFAQAWNTGELLRALRMCRDGAPADPGSAS
jgi:glycogen debranching enzyme